MQVIYADSLFALNMAVDYLILLLSARICAAPLKRRRYAAAAAIGGLYAVLCALPPLEFLVTGAGKAAAAGLMCVTAYGGEHRPARQAATFIAVAACFGGAVYAASTVGGAQPGATTYMQLSLPTLALCFAGMWALIAVVFRRAALRSGRKLYQVKATLGQKTCALTVLHDSGNGLYDPVSGKPVMTVYAKALAPLLGEAASIAAETDPMAAFARLCQLPELYGRVLLVPYSSVGVGAGLMPVFRPDSLAVDGESRDDVLIGITAGYMSEDYDGVL